MTTHNAERSEHRAEDRSKETVEKIRVLMAEKEQRVPDLRGRIMAILEEGGVRAG